MDANWLACDEAKFEVELLNLGLMLPVVARLLFRLPFKYKVAIDFAVDMLTCLLTLARSLTLSSGLFVSIPLSFRKVLLLLTCYLA